MPRDTSRDFQDLEWNISRFRYIEKKNNLEILKSRLNNYEKLASRDCQSRDGNLEILCEIVSRSRKKISRCPSIVYSKV